jgi:hypothetical protein
MKCLGHHRRRTYDLLIDQQKKYFATGLDGLGLWMIKRRAIFVFDSKVLLDPLIVEPREVRRVGRAVACYAHR